MPRSARPGRLACHRHPEKPFAAARSAAQPNAAPRSQARQRKVFTRQHFPVVIGDHNHLLRIGKVDPPDRIRHRHQASKPSQACVAVAVTPRHATSVTHERPPPAMGHQARQAHQEDVPTPRTDTQNVFLCRGHCVAVSRSDEQRVRRRRPAQQCARYISRWPHTLLPKRRYARASFNFSGPIITPSVRSW
jgi:hypothetical protein